LRPGVDGQLVEDRRHVMLRHPGAEEVLVRQLLRLNGGDAEHIFPWRWSTLV
jgi:hypothetical protein